MDLSFHLDDVVLFEHFDNIEDLGGQFILKIGFSHNFGHAETFSVGEWQMEQEFSLGDRQAETMLLAVAPLTGPE